MFVIRQIFYGLQKDIIQLHINHYGEFATMVQCQQVSISIKFVS
jgi:hypothetical protein